MESQIEPPSLSEDNSTIVMANVFDAVWSGYIELEGPGADTADDRGRLAAYIIVLFRTAADDEEEIVNAALTYLRALAAARRIGAQKRPSTTVASSHSHSPSASFAPETVEAMAQALDLCFEELPLRISSEAQSLLKSSILDAARRGERDPVHMHATAMKALKSRR